MFCYHSHRYRDDFLPRSFPWIPCHPRYFMVWFYTPCRLLANIWVSNFVSWCHFSLILWRFSVSSPFLLMSWSFFLIHDLVIWTWSLETSANSRTASIGRKLFVAARVHFVVVLSLFQLCDRMDLEISVSTNAGNSPSSCTRDFYCLSFLRLPGLCC